MHLLVLSLNLNEHSRGPENDVCYILFDQHLTGMQIIAVLSSNKGSGESAHMIVHMRKLIRSIAACVH